MKALKIRYILFIIGLVIISSLHNKVNAETNENATINSKVEKQKKIVWYKLFKENKLPKSFCYLPCIVSNFDITFSQESRIGIWGLNPTIAIKYGLIIDENIDQRYDIKLSTIASLEYLTDLMRYYDDENITAKAFVYGAAYIDDCNKREEDIILDTKECEIDYTKIKKLYNRDDLTEIIIKRPVRIEKICDTLAIEETQFREDNLSIKENAIWLKKGYNIYISNEIDIDSALNKIEQLYISEEIEIERNRELQQLLEKAEKEAREREIAEAIKRANAVKIYVVKSGDTLGAIAYKYRVTVSKLKKWNNIKSDIIQIGQKIKIYPK